MPALHVHCITKAQRSGKTTFHWPLVSAGMERTMAALICISYQLCARQSELSCISGSESQWLHFRTAETLTWNLDEPKELL